MPRLVDDGNLVQNLRLLQSAHAMGGLRPLEELIIVLEGMRKATSIQTGFAQALHGVQDRWMVFGHDSFLEL